MPILSTSTLAGYFNVSARTIESLAADGVLVRIERGRFDLKDSTRRYTEHLRRSASGRAAAEETAQAKQESLQASARLKTEQQKALAQRIERERGELVARSEVVRLVRGWTIFFRSEMLGLVPRARRRLGLSFEASEEFRKLIFEILVEISKKRPSDICPGLDDDEAA